MRQFGWTIRAVLHVQRRRWVGPQRDLRWHCLRCHHRRMFKRHLLPPLVQHTHLFFHFFEVNHIPHLRSEVLCSTGAVDGNGQATGLPWTCGVGWARQSDFSNRACADGFCTQNHCCVRISVCFLGLKRRLCFAASDHHGSVSQRRRAATPLGLAVGNMNAPQR